MTTKPITFESIIEKQDISFEDGGCAVIIEPDWKVQGGDNSIFVRIQSWDDQISEHPMYDKRDSREDKAKLGHQSIQSLFGKKVKVTIEVVDE